ncbi:Fzd5p [Cichlidogyrus casuarinus]|uniref:Fzd5p n=1 Tax=Cichlidogyrus casuarinus TaxID=1844966 RepID=A0ABD2PS85_9PLAT
MALIRIVAWGLPTAAAIMSVALATYDSDPVSGICFVGGTSPENLLAFVVIPLLVFWITGVVILTAKLIRMLKRDRTIDQGKIALTTDLQSHRLASVYCYLSFFMLSLLLLFFGLQYKLEENWLLKVLCPCYEGVLNKKNVVIFYRTKYTVWLLICVLDVWPPLGEIWNKYFSRDTYAVAHGILVNNENSPAESVQSNKSYLSPQTNHENLIYSEPHQVDCTSSGIWVEDDPQNSYVQYSSSARLPDPELRKPMHYNLLASNTHSTARL